MDKKSRELVMAKLYFKNKDYKMAETSFSQYLSMVPDDVSALKLLAQVYEQTKRYDKAFEMYERCYLAEPDRTGVLLDICRLLMNDIWLDHVDYKKWLNLAIRAFPSNPIVVNLKAFLSTLPANDSVSSQPEPPTKTNEDALSKILEKLSLIDTRLDKIEQNMNRFKNMQIDYSKPQEPEKSQVGLVPKEELPVKNACDLPETSPKTKEKDGGLFGQPIPNTSGSSIFGQLPKSQPFINHNSSGITTGNLFADSMARLNSQPNFSFSFNSPKQQESEEPHDDLVPNEELPIENTCDLPEINLKTGEEDEDLLFESRCKLYRFRDKEYKERGLGNIKILKHRETGKLRLIMRRDVIGLVCLNCFDCKSWKRQDESRISWIATDISDEQPEISCFLVKFKLPETAQKFLALANPPPISSTKSSDLPNLPEKGVENSKAEKPKSPTPKPETPKPETPKTKLLPEMNSSGNSIFGQIQTSSSSIFGQPITNTSGSSIFGQLPKFGQELSQGPSLFNFSGSTTGNLFADSMARLNSQPNFNFSFNSPKQQESEEPHDDLVPNEELPIENTCDLPEINLKTGEEDEDLLFESRCKLYRLRDKEYKERGLGNIKILKHRETGKLRLIMRRDVIGLVCLNCFDCKSWKRQDESRISWIATDISDEQPEFSCFLVKFKLAQTADEFLSHVNCEEPEIELVDPKLDQNLVDKARKLQLPDLFYHKIKNQDPCSGCGGCENDE